MDSNHDKMISDQDDEKIQEVAPRRRTTWKQLIPAKGVVSRDMNLLNIRPAFDTDLSQGRTEGGCKKLLVLASAADPVIS